MIFLWMGFALYTTSFQRVGNFYIRLLKIVWPAESPISTELAGAWRRVWLLGALGWRKILVVVSGSNSS